MSSARFKSYQLVKVVSGCCAPAKSSILASPQHLISVRFHCFGAVRLEKLNFCMQQLSILVFDHTFKGAYAAEILLLLGFLFR